MPRFIRIPLTPEQADRLEHFQGSPRGIYLFHGSPHIDLRKADFDKLCQVQAKGETIAETLMSALETGLVQR